MGFGRNEETGRVGYRRLSIARQGERKPPPIHLCLFTELHNNCYQPDITFWTRVYSTRAAKRSTRCQRQLVNDKPHSRPFNVALDKMKQAVLRDFQDDLSLARLILFAVFRFCLTLLRDLGAKICEQPSTKPDLTDLTDTYLGFLYVDLLLENIVEHLGDDNKRPFMRYWRQLNLAKDAITNVSQNSKYEDFLWTV